MDSSQSNLAQTARRALDKIRELRAQLETERSRNNEAIAIVGMACRFPGGGNSPEAFWRVLRDGVDTATEAPKARWDLDQYYDPEPGTPGKMYTRMGCFIDDADCFDASFFGVTA
jgi:acyl transferase domain-containing protein